MTEQPNTYIYRTLLLLLLPVIAVVIYLDGQKYDPGLLDFKKTEGANSALLNLLPPNAGKFERIGNVRLFDKDNLFEHINGHAEYFISGGFTALAVADYAKQGKKEPCCSIDIYQMGSGANAFGVLMGEISDDFTRTEIGFMGFLSPRTLAFMKGLYYIKVGGYQSDAPLKELAEAIEKGMGNMKTVIPELEHFPKEGALPGSLRYFKEDYRGLDFLSRVFEQDYNLDGVNFQAALIEGDKAYITKIVERYLSFFKEEETAYEKMFLGNQAYYFVKDPFEGDWMMIPMKERIFALYGTVDKMFAIRFLAGNDAKR